MCAFSSGWEYAGLSGGRTTMDADYQMFANPMAQQPYSGASAPAHRPDIYKATTPGKPDPNTQLPLGDAVAPMLLMLVGYALWRRRRRLQNP